MSSLFLLTSKASKKRASWNWKRDNWKKKKQVETGDDTSKIKRDCLIGKSAFCDTKRVLRNKFFAMRQNAKGKRAQLKERVEEEGGRIGRSHMTTGQNSTGNSIRRSRRLRSDEDGRNESSNTPNGDNVVKVGFIEPVLSNSSIVTGQPLEQPPSVKIMKELGAFNKSSSINGTEDQKIEDKYQKNIKLNVQIEKSTVLSDLRTKSKPTTKNKTEKILKNRPLANRQKPRRTIDDKLRRNLSGLTLKLSTVGNNDHSDNNKNAFQSISPISSPDSSSDGNPTNLNQDYCSCCGMVGMFLCCESCPKSFHFDCINPPIDSKNLPDFWYCKDCIKKKIDHNNNENSNHLTANTGIYAKLFDSIMFQDCLSFQLPKEIIESFQGISIDKLGDYNDDTLKPLKSYKQLMKDFDDPLNGIYDKNNNPFFCYYCGESGLNNKELIHCDYCSLSWHIDCLNPPLTSIKKLGSKWKCPNHIDDLDVPRRRFKDPEIIEISNISNFEKNGRLPINSSIDIINIEDKLNKLKNEVKLLNQNSCCFNSNLKFSNLIFKINEEDIILNFINSAKIKKINDNNLNLFNLMNLKPNLKDYVLSLSKLSEKSIVDNDFKLLNLQKLLKITDDELKIQNKEFTDDEIKEFLIIQKLIKSKGKEKLLEFLNSS